MFSLLLRGLTLVFQTDIDQLTRILLLCGTPDPEFLGKITSDEVGGFLCVFPHTFLRSVSINVVLKARNYIRSLPKMEKKNLHEVFKGANPLGKFDI